MSSENKNSAPTDLGRPKRRDSGGTRVVKNNKNNNNSANSKPN